MGMWKFQLFCYVFLHLFISRFTATEKDWIDSPREENPT